VIDIAQGQPLVAQFQLFAFCGGKVRADLVQKELSEQAG